MTLVLMLKPDRPLPYSGVQGRVKHRLMALLTRFYDYEDGEILLEGVDLNQYPKYFLRETIGVVEQEPFLLFSTSIRENITYGVHRDVTDEEVYAAARAAAVHDVIMEFPEGYNTKVGERGVTLIRWSETTCCFSANIAQESENPDSG